jgi:hypothetical protein
MLHPASQACPKTFRPSFFHSIHAFGQKDGAVSQHHEENRSGHTLVSSGFRNRTIILLPVPSLPCLDPFGRADFMT